VIVQGPRACGKTTVITQVVETYGREVLDVAEPSNQLVASQDPAAYLANRAEPVFIDEFQRVPDLFPVVKRSVDRDPRYGAFVLTGSTTQDLLPKGSETLAGRSAVVTMWGFSQGEIQGVRERFVDRLFDEPELLLSHRGSWSRSDYSRVVATGGFPEAVRRTRVEAKRRWQTEYASRIADRDLAELVRLRQPGVVESFVVAEVVKQPGWAASICEPWYFRDAEGNEVDLVLERNDGSLVGIEVKAGVTVGPPDAKGLRRFRDLVGDRFVHGVVLYTGTGSFRMDGDPQITAHPISALWSE
jgi:predicted AAA+ superfamily ATPase